MIKHDGIVIAVNEDGMVRVRIVQTSACAACKAKAMCASAESKEKELTAFPVQEGSGSKLTVGDEVIVMVQQKMGWKAVLLAYLLPFVVMMGIIILGNEVMSILGGGTPGKNSEAIIGTIALCSLAVYYIILGFFKDRIQKEFSFTARKK